jgi:hypothetical protein
VHAHLGRHAAQHQRRDAEPFEDFGEVGAVERAVAGLVDDDFAGHRAQFVDEVVTVLAAHQQPPERAARADRRAGGDAARELGRRAVRQVRPVALARVHDEHAGSTRGAEQAADRRDRRGEPRDVEPGAVGIAARRAEVALHVDHDERRRRAVEHGHRHRRRLTESVPRSPRRAAWRPRRRSAGPWPRRHRAPS